MKWPRSSGAGIGVGKEAGTRSWLHTIEHSCGRLGRHPCLLPRPKAAVKRPNASETAIEEYARQTGARGFARSRAVENDLFVGRQRVDVALERARRDPPRAWNHERRPVERLLASQVDDE